MTVRNRNYALADQLLETLEEQGHRDTEPRRKVVAAIARKNRHFTAEELRGELPGIGRATVYRALKLLVQAGALCRVMLADGALHYQLNDSAHHGHHHHLLCVHCGESEDVQGCDIEGQLHSLAAARQFQITGHWLEVYGQCYSCADSPALPA